MHFNGRCLYLIENRPINDITVNFFTKSSNRSQMTSQCGKNKKVAIQSFGKRVKERKGTLFKCLVILALEH